MNYFDLANEQYLNKNYEKAIVLYHKAVLAKENEASALYNCAVCNIKLNKYNEAILLLKDALSKKSDSKYFFNLGYCFNMVGDYKRALIYFNRAWSLNNSDDDCRKAINYILSRQKV